MSATPAPAAANDPDDALILGRNISKVFRDFWGRPRIKAVNDVNITVRKGRVFGLLGPNGAGKSTLIKMILGHLYPTTGRLEVFGRPPTDVESKLRLGYLPERAYLYRNLTPEETLRFFGQILELPSAEIKSRTAQLLEMVGLEQSRKRLVGEFSHGMSRRMGLAQALLNDPDLLLLDEPTAGLDPLGCREVKNLIMTLARRGKTILLTSHLLADVEDVCDEVTIMYGGSVLASGDIRELLADKGTLQIRCPEPSEATLRQISELLYKDVDRDAVEFSSPTRSLENYFVDIVRKASQKQETAGAQVGKGVATYLRSGVAEDESMLDTLAHARKAPVATPSAGDVAAANAARTAAAADDALLGRLAAEPTPPKAAAGKATMSNDDENVDEALLDNLIQGGDDDDQR